MKKATLRPTSSSKKRSRQERRPRSVQPASPIDAQFARAITRHREGNFAEAEARYRAILGLEPRHFESLTLLGTICLQRGKNSEAIRLIELSLGINPHQPLALNNLGNALQNALRIQEAIARYDQAIAVQPDYADAYNNRGVALHGLQRYEESLASFEKAIAIRPGYADAHSNRGNLLKAMKRYDEALECYDRAIAIAPDYAAAHYNRGNVLKVLNRQRDALACYDRALALQPGYAEAWVNRGLAMQQLNRLEEAIESHDRAIALQPDYADAYNNRGNALKDAGRHGEALASYDRAIALKPEYAEAYWNKSLLLLLLGRFEEGWQLYEWRWKKDDATANAPHFDQPLWLGREPLAGRTILVHAEQGFGDTIQFCRYVPMLAASGARVVLQVQEPLVGLISTLAGSFDLLKTGDPLPEFDCQCPLLSLPLALKTTLTTIPGNAPYLASEPGKNAIWARRLGARARRRVGLVWSGRPDHYNDQNRSIPPLAVLPLLDADAEFHCLQKELRPADREFLAQHSQIRSYEYDLGDFSDTAALVDQMDMVVTVDTSIAHLAGALGKAVWILLPFSPDFRWLTERSDSPWYPSARLFRQPRPGDWESVIRMVGMVAAELDAT